MMDYLWLKALHVAIALIFVGGLLVQAIGVAAGARGGSETLEIVSRWDERVTLPSMLAVWLTGALVATTGGWLSSPWLWVKLVVVIALSGLHGVQAGRIRRLRGVGGLQPNTNPYAVSIAICLAVIIIAVLAVTKPL